MAKNPLYKLARLVGGVAMLPGPLGYQVLGQLLISRSRTAEVAGAYTALAAVSQQANAATQIVVRTLAPAIAADVLIKKEERRLQRLHGELVQQQQDLDKQKTDFQRQKQEYAITTERERERENQHVSEPKLQKKQSGPKTPASPRKKSKTHAQNQVTTDSLTSPPKSTEVVSDDNAKEVRQDMSNKGTS